MTTIAYCGPGNDHQRRDKRFTQPVLGVFLSGKVYPTRDWSMGGFRIGGYSGNHRRGDTIIIAGIVAGPDRFFPLTISAEVVRINRTHRELAAHVTGMDNRAFTLLERLIMHRSQWPGIGPQSPPRAA